MNTENEYTGTVRIDLCGEPRTLRFSWSTIAKLRAAHGEHYGEHIHQVLATMDVEGLAAMLELLTGVSAKKIMEDPPPVVEACGAISEAFRIALYGPKREPPESDEGKSASSPTAT